MLSRISALICAWLICSSILVAQAPINTSTVIAEVNGQKLTTADLEGQENSGLLQARYDYYQAERKALESAIDQRLLAMQAAREHLTVDQLLQREVNSKVSDPTEDQLRVYYEGLQTRESFESVRDQVLDHIREIRREKVRKAYLESLRNNANIVIALTPPTADVPLSGSYVRGRADAQVLIVEFADYQCPFCQGVNPDLERLRKEFGDKVAVAYKDFPLPMHPNAERAAEAARCAGAQGKFWEFHDVLFRDKQLEPAALKQLARTLNLDAARFDKCLDSGEQSRAVKRDYNEAVRVGLSGTPSFFINGHFLSGALDYGTLRDVVQQQLRVIPAAGQNAAAKEFPEQKP